MPLAPVDKLTSHPRLPRASADTTQSRHPQRVAPDCKPLIVRSADDDLGAILARAVRDRVPTLANGTSRYEPLSRAPTGARLLQRGITIDPKITAQTGLGQAIADFSTIEQADLDPAEWELLRSQHQRVMPLLGRFALARQTDLVVGLGRQSVVGDMALTSLIGKTQSGRIDEENNKTAFYDAATAKAFRSFVIGVTFNTSRVRPPGAQSSMLTHPGPLLQSFTHEMTVHAENMLDWTEGYWRYVDGQGALPPPLLSAPEEHLAYRDQKVLRYEYMKRRVRSRGGDVASGFDSREGDDKRMMSLPKFATSAVGTHK
jgi:hypothetical protein